MAGSAPAPHRVMGNLNDAWATIVELERKVEELERKLIQLLEKK